jgi:hypothetical protein
VITVDGASAVSVPTLGEMGRVLLTTLVAAGVRAPCVRQTAQGVDKAKPQGCTSTPDANKQSPFRLNLALAG